MSKETLRNGLAGAIIMLAFVGFMGWVCWSVSIKPYVHYSTSTGEPVEAFSFSGEPMPLDEALKVRHEKVPVR